MRFIYFQRKMAKLFANSGDLDQTPRSAESDLALHCLPIALQRVSRLQWVNFFFFFFEKIRLEISCESSAQKKSSLIFLEKKERKYFKAHLL